MLVSKDGRWGKMPKAGVVFSLKRNRVVIGKVGGGGGGRRRGGSKSPVGVEVGKGHLRGQTDREKIIRRKGERVNKKGKRDERGIVVKKERMGSHYWSKVGGNC